MYKPFSDFIRASDFVAKLKVHCHDDMACGPWYKSVTHLSPVSTLLTPPRACGHR